MVLSGGMAARNKIVLLTDLKCCWSTLLVSRTNLSEGMKVAKQAGVFEFIAVFVDLIFK